MARVLVWLDAYTRADQHRPEGLCPGGKPDVAGIRTSVFDVYLRERSNGASEIEAREALVRAMAPRASAPAGPR